MSKGAAVLPGRSRCMDSGTLSPLVEKFSDRLISFGHTRRTTARYLDSARHFCHWLWQTGVAPSDVNDALVEQFARHRCKCSGIHRARLSIEYVNRVRRFISFLAEHGVVRAAPPPGPEAVDKRVLEFQQWLRIHRGACECTIKRCGRLLMKLLPALGGDPADYDARLIRRVMIEEARERPRSYAKSMATALRGYLRFLAARGECRSSLDRAIPSIRQWRMSALPRYLPVSDIERLIASCDRTKPSGIRDRAILLLLARLGLRAGDIVMMRLDDIAWEEGTLRVRGKGRRETGLPLPQEVGDAVLDYLATVRPVVDCDRVFLRLVAPYRALAASTSISCVVKFALQRAGITNSPSRGANLLRHSAATAMLRAGATLEAIGAVLRHRSVDTTAHYAKVDIAALCQIAQPWPGEV
jgi:integrase/recombinase XerD